MGGDVDFRPIESCRSYPSLASDSLSRRVIEEIDTPPAPPVTFITQRLSLIVSGVHGRSELKCGGGGGERVLEAELESLIYPAARCRVV